MLRTTSLKMDTGPPPRGKKLCLDKSSRYISTTYHNGWFKCPLYVLLSHNGTLTTVPHKY